MRHLTTIILAIIFTATCAHAQAGITLTPALVTAGSPELIRIEASDARAIDGEWLGHPIAFFHPHEGRFWFALAGVDVEAPAGSSTLTIHIHAADGTTHDVTQPIDIHEAHYRTGTLSVAPKFVEPNPDELKEIEAEVQLKAKVFASSAPEPLWTGNFRPPVPARATDSFGTRRMFNGKIASIHKGADFHAATGTPVHASNDGIVVLARPLYFEGKCVVIDHGLGLYTLSMHFSRIDVHEGDHVAKGQLIGLSGATGRVTGPHLHWAVRWGSAYLDPVKLLRMNLSTVH